MNWQQEAGSRELGEGNKEQGAGKWERRARNWEKGWELEKEIGSWELGSWDRDGNLALLVNVVMETYPLGLFFLLCDGNVSGSWEQGAGSRE